MRFFRRADILIILGLLVVSAGVWAGHRAVNQGRPAKAEIYYYNELVLTVDLAPGVDKTFSIPQNENVVFHQYADGSIRFASSDCPDKVCVHAGTMSMPGQSAACLPNGIILKIVAAGPRSPDDPDVVVG